MTKAGNSIHFSCSSGSGRDRLRREKCILSPILVSTAYWWWAVTLMGVVLANEQSTVVQHIVRFKEDLINNLDALQGKKELQIVGEGIDATLMLTLFAIPKNR